MGAVYSDGKGGEDSSMGKGPNLGSVKKALRNALPNLRQSYNVETLAIFGSVVRGESDPGSDIDILVRFHGDPPGFFDFVRLERRLSEIIGFPVDLVMESALKPRLRERILSEAQAVAA